MGFLGLPNKYFGQRGMTTSVDTITEISVTPPVHLHSATALETRL